MKIDAVRVAGDELILKSPDYAEIRRFAYNFKSGNYEIARKRKKRSLDANSYFWHIVTEIANVLRADKYSIYEDMLRRYGQSDMWAAGTDVNPADHFEYYDFFDKRTVHGTEVNFYVVYKGSSKYDSREFSILLDGTIDEAKALDIEVISEREKSLLLMEWERNEKK